MELPQNPMKGNTLGAIVLLPRKTANSSQYLYTCTISAGWGSSLLSTSSGIYTVDPVSSQANLPLITQQKITQNLESFSESKLSHFQQIQSYEIGVFNEPNYPERPITITPAWADYLNPFVPSINTTVFNALVSLDGVFIPRHTLAAIMLVGLVTNGLARVGFKNRLQGSLKTFRNSKTNDTVLDGNCWISGKGDFFIVDPIESKDWVKLPVESGLQGYAYNTTGTAPKVAIAFLLTYCLFALSHILYAGFSGMMSFTSLLCLTGS